MRIQIWIQTNVTRNGGFGVIWQFGLKSQAQKLLTQQKCKIMKNREIIFGLFYKSSDHK